MSQEISKNSPLPEPQSPGRPEQPELPEGVLRVRTGPGANCSSAGSAIDVLFYGSVIAGALAVALSAAFPPREPPPPSNDEQSDEHDDDKPSSE